MKQTKCYHQKSFGKNQKTYYPFDGWRHHPTVTRYKAATQQRLRQSDNHVKGGS